ncbi:DUF1849 family protein [Pelagibius litoralis]|uniref:DUF1849 family protein n=1 Tax=Pelagibius litoralis TaxID=374515 RepID=A0A967EZJ0_9PROT|nr:DUF1849 family protein [Pelagibius litoralis]NIA70265.1 DUF1849 family protein [Pelagibius litoralis]
MYRYRLIVLAALAGIWTSPASAAGAGPAVDLVPHSATYYLTLGDATSVSPVVQAQGRFEFEWADACDGWTVVQKFRVQLLYEDGFLASFGWSLSSWESKDGKRYRFFVRRFDGAGESERVRGEAQLGDDGSGRAIFTEPQEREVALPAGTLFPTQHTIDVLARAGDGQTPHWRLVFDGSGDEGLFGVSTALSRNLPAGAETQIASPLLSQVPSWRLNLAFYGPDESKAEPEQEQGLRLFANGVVDEMRLDYGDFVLNADLSAVESIAAPAC